MYYLQKGRVKVSVTSKQGKEAVVAILGTGDFLGEGCLAGQANAITSATAMEETRVLQMERDLFQRTLHNEQTFADFFCATFFHATFTSKKT